MNPTNNTVEIETLIPNEIVDPKIDALSTVIEDVRRDAVEGAGEYLQDTIVPAGGE